MAAAAQPPPGLFTFFKHGALLPARNRGLFLPILALTATLSVVISRLALPLENFQLEVAAVLVDDNANVHAELRPPLLTAGAVFVAAAVVNPAIKIIIFSAAVASYTGERHTLVSILGKVRSNLWAPLVTLAFGFVLQFAAQLPLLLLPYSFSLPYNFSFIQQPALYALIVLASLPVKAICDVAVVASVAEPGQRGPRAAARARRLMEGKKAQAALYVAAEWTLWLLYKLARWWLPQSVASELPAVDVAFVLLQCADQVFSMAVVTAYYFECRRSQRQD